MTSYELDLLYDKVDYAMRLSRWSWISFFLRTTDTKMASSSLLMGMLVSTLPAKTKIEYRPKFIHDCEIELRSRGEWVDGLFDGLY